MEDIKIKVWGIFSLNKKQILIFELFFLTVFVGLTVFLFSYDFKPHLNDSGYTFHAKYAKYISLACTFLIIIEAQFFWSQFTKNQLDIIKEQKKELDRKNTNIQESIKYASKIQKVLLPSKGKLNRLLKEHFVLYRPRDVVSGDFYWIEEFAGKTIIAVADCTGHGVPGAFVSAMGISLLNEIVLLSKEKESELTPAKILEELKNRFHYAAQNTENEETFYEGMDISVCIIDPNEHKYTYSGALMSIIHVSKTLNEADSAIIQMKPDVTPVGMGSVFKEEEKYTDNVIAYEENDILYLYSDGYKDQFGGEKNKKFMNAGFIQLIDEIAQMPMVEQLNAMTASLEKWKGDIPQVDDITVVGIKL